MFAGHGKRYRLFSLFGFDIYAQSSILILVVIYLLLGSSRGPQGAIHALIFVIVAFLSILVHEFGHALMVRRLGYGESEIVLHGLGGLTQWRGSPNRRDRILISVSGPAAGLILGSLTLLGLMIFGTPEELLLRVIFIAVLWINIGWSIINLLPVWPLDGGQVVRTALTSANRSRSKTVALSLKTSMITAIGLIALFLVMGYIFAAVLFGLILWSNYNEWKREQGPPQSFYGY